MKQYKLTQHNFKIYTEKQNHADVVKGIKLQC